MFPVRVCSSTRVPGWRSASHSTVVRLRAFAQLDETGGQLDPGLVALSIQLQLAESGVAVISLGEVPLDAEEPRDDRVETPRHSVKPVCQSHSAHVPLGQRQPLETAVHLPEAVGNLQAVLVPQYGFAGFAPPPGQPQTA